RRLPGVPAGAPALRPPGQRARPAVQRRNGRAPLHEELPMRLSIVTTMYRSAPYVAAFHERALAAARGLGVEPEFVYVNDGSPDEALAVALVLRRRYRNVRVVDLSRNFGHHQAMMAGLAHATGERVFLIDCDLEEAPELLGSFLAAMDRTGADVVYGVQSSRGDARLSRLLARAYYRLP